jgi:hypothetical protein
MMRRKPELGKYLLWRHFHGNLQIRPYLPDTKRYTRERVEVFLQKYSMIYVKPSGGSMGRGIMKVWKQDSYIYVKKTVLPSRRFTSVEEAAQYIDRMREGKPYIVQKGLILARVNDRPFDIRVMMQRDSVGGPWLYSGMVAKIAGKGSVVTNVALSKGRVTTVEEALRQSLGLSETRIHEIVHRMKQLGYAAAKHFDTYQPYRELGFDMAVDTSSRLWLIEQNTAPSHRLFAKLKSNPRLFRRIEYRWANYARSLRKNR